MKQKLLGFIFVFFCLCAQSIAQNRQVGGRVTSSLDGAALSGVSVTVMGTSTATQTDASGNYSINVPGNGTLIFTYLGYIEQRIAVESRGRINVLLESGETALDEVVITGYTQVRRSQFAGAASTVSAKELNDQPVASITQLLQGKAPGVLANSGSGLPGANARITIRGTQSISGAGAQPLYVIDGVPSSESAFQTLNHNDIESLTVLKDANSAAVYGARAGVGVIVITTKKGRSGGIDITAKTQFGVTKAPKFDRLNLMSTAELLAYEEVVGSIATPNFGAPGWFYSRKNPANASLSEAQLAEYDRKLDSTRNINTDLRDVFFRTGTSQTHELNASGGTEELKFFSSLGAFQQDGIDKTSGLKRYTGRTNVTFNKNNFFMQATAFGGYSQTKQAVGDFVGNSAVNPFQMIYRAKPYDNPYREDGSLNYGGGGGMLNNKSVANVLENNMNTRDHVRRVKLNASVNLEYTFLNDFKIKNILGIDATDALRSTYINPDSYRGSLQTYQSGYAREGSSFNSQLINTTSLTYSKILNDVHEFQAAGYFEGIRVHEKAIGFTLYNLNKSLPWTGQGAGALPTEGNATMPQNAASARSGYGIRSYFATLNYTYDDRISLNGNIRRDGTSRIVNPENKEITTWSLGAIWNLSKEKFMGKQSIFSDVRLRGSYGVVPNISSISLGDYSFSGMRVVNYAGTQMPAYSAISYPGSTIGGLYPSSPGNYNLKIERIHKANLGVDFGIYDNRARFVVDLYSNKTVDMFVSQPMSSTTAFTSMDINAGKMVNKGIEFQVDVDVLRRQDWGVTVGLNHAINKNEITDLGLVEEYLLGTFIIKKGLAYGTHIAYDYLGADPQTGKPIYRKPDGTSTTNFSEAEEFYNFGSFVPKHVGGFNLDVRYKKVTLGALFSYQFDVVRSNNTRNWITDGTAGYTGIINQSRELLTNQWRQPGDQKFFPSPAYSKNFTSSDLENAKFLKLRSVSLAYQLPNMKMNNGKSIFKGGQVYFNGFNLMAWSPWRGVDPEDSDNLSLNEYPNPKMFVFGLDLKF
ncbi:SusC/RagA family TonB-linked outer membrane protein [Sphingobacterium sp. UT-1RO-CII-1]|uniref:SusC/RagA family TonB-linked outer membrane protein n=1 Tax=Sphingobacterium sp. UT-1RO-CII-1 TaxID=2995225 RepID=UPI00227A7956|nr:SusC/RagA family TonB-linked outer membrane protein [Sphingobacterium sp. UT-1RO-CII-1]MCY4780770.1 SusC/RagA family TonB-linked outer membrane protein [Sphingobacterium sp. UT-1RO-CII-1]